MTDHSITPPQWRVQEWWEQADQYQDDPKTYFDYVATEAARWGADQELEACIEWLDHYVPRYPEWSANFRVARRPKPPSLKEQALEVVTGLEKRWDLQCDLTLLRRALEQLDD